MRRVGLGIIALLLMAGLVPVHGDDATRTGRDGTVLQAVPAGRFWMGRDPAPGVYAVESPRHSAITVAFYMARTLVTERQYATFVAQAGYRPRGPWTPEHVVGQELHPVTDVTWDDAEAYCDWVHGRLPSEAEWEKTARGTDERLFPWGNEFDDALCDSSAEGSARGTMPVATFSDNVSPYGCLDMAGNVWEWTADWFHAYPGSSAQDDAENLYRAVRGGSWLCRDAHSCCTTYRIGRPPDVSAADVGFRYCIDVRP